MTIPRVEFKLGTCESVLAANPKMHVSLTVHVDGAFVSTLGFANYAQWCAFCAAVAGEGVLLTDSMGSCLL